MISKLNHGRLGTVDGQPKIDHKPAFNKITKRELNQSINIDFSSGLYLRKLTHLLKTMDEFVSDTFIYNSNKEFLVNVVNQRNSIIIHKIKENIETVRLICAMDRNYRAKRSQNIMMQTLIAPRVYAQNGIQIYRQICSKAELEVEQNVFQFTTEKSNLEVPELDLFESNFDIEFEDRDNSNAISNDELETLFSDTSLVSSVACLDKGPHSSKSDNCEKDTRNYLDIEGLTPSITSNPEINEAVNKIMADNKITVTYKNSVLCNTFKA